MNVVGGLLKDDVEEARLYKFSADQGNESSQIFLGAFYENGRGGQVKDQAEALRLYRLAAAQGNVMAQNKLKALESTQVQSSVGFRDHASAPEMLTF